ncbi:Malonyl CoA-acyl carrier protein transacylase [Kibdelosporangium sp. 4NS15]|uniref:Malonyl CoA-acyl carrier protein transacylase n=1 Tax=Kibdelosporangium persicum TaxID=2698649 RepID=A0ABX2F868_9PSEU|nr:Malonyl CoA-acyl carrier protein transacylase [Kibdelosporangium persicum]
MDAYWDLLNAGRDAVTTMSPERQAVELSKSDSDAMHVIPPDAQGGYLDWIDKFDAPFFEMSPYEAVRLDPQQRVLLETVWEAVEDAGLTTDQLSASRTGAYTSCFASQYWNMLSTAGVHDIHALLGASRYSVAAGRIAHLLNLRGPALGMEASCASSLVAVHVACQAIQADEIEMAIVSSANLLLCRNLELSGADAGLLSPTLRSRFGDRNADGFVPAEGAVTVILKRLSRAVEDGDQIYATILGSGVGSNGTQTQSLTDLAVTGLQDTFDVAYRAAGVSPGQVDYVEAHGTGTPEGDMTELSALSNFLREGRSPEQPCLVGSAKSNIGHTAIAAGLTGLLKAVLALRNRVIPRTLHVCEPSAVFDREDSPIKLATAREVWPDRERPGIAGVTSLGMFGTSAHMVLTEAPPTVATPRRKPSGTEALLMPLSAKNPTALRQLATAYAETLETAEDPVDVCFSAGVRRTQHNVRLAVAAADRQSLIDELREFGSGGRALFPVGSANRTAERPRVVFVFPGHGSQWTGMGRELLAESPVFAERIAECDQGIAQELGWSLVERLREGTPLSAIDEVQPALWAIQVGLAAMWRDWGIEPDLIVGHSMGEFAAATAAGALSVRDAAMAVCRRSRLMRECAGNGEMWAVGLNEAQALELIREHGDSISVGVLNSAYLTVLSGDAAALAKVVEPLRQRGVFCRQVSIGFASHSAAVDPMLPAMRAHLAGLRPRAAEVPIYSTVVDRLVEGTELDTEYWVANLRQPVRFASAIQAVLADQQQRTVFIEVSPHPVLTNSVEDSIDIAGANAEALPSLHRNSPEMVSLLSSLASMYTHGYVPDWERVTPGGRYVPLPRYPWQRERYWVNPSDEPDSTTSAPAAGLHRQEGRAVDVDVITRQIKLRLAEVLAMSPDMIDPTVPLTFSGLDSLLAAKLRTRMQQELDLHIPIRDFLSNHSLNDLATRAHRTGYGPAS